MEPRSILKDEDLLVPEADAMSQAFPEKGTRMMRGEQWVKLELRREPAALIRRFQTRTYGAQPRRSSDVTGTSDVAIHHRNADQLLDAVLIEAPHPTRRPLYGVECHRRDCSGCRRRLHLERAVKCDAFAGCAA